MAANQWKPVGMMVDSGYSKDEFGLNVPGGSLRASCRLEASYGLRIIRTDVGGVNIQVAEMEFYPFQDELEIYGDIGSLLAHRGYVADTPGLPADVRGMLTMAMNTIERRRTR